MYYISGEELHIMVKFDLLTISAFLCWLLWRGRHHPSISLLVNVSSLECCFLSDSVRGNRKRISWTRTCCLTSIPGKLSVKADPAEMKVLRNYLNDAELDIDLRGVYKLWSNIYRCDTKYSHYFRSKWTIDRTISYYVGVKDDDYN